MGRKSKLTEKQWEDIGKRLLAGEKARALAREFDISEAAIRARLSAQTAEIKTVANQVVAAESALKALPISSQIAALNLADELRAISSHLASAAKYGAASAHRLAGIAHDQVSKVDDAEPEKSLEVLQRFGVLTKLSNESAQLGINLLSANKEMIKESNAGGGQSKDEFLQEIVKHLPD
jgi:hypothetical protein